PMFATREGSFMSQLEKYQQQGTNVSQGLSAIGGHMKREMGRLRAKWNTKLEIAARDAEYRQQKIRQRKLEQESSQTVQGTAATADDLRALPERPDRDRLSGSDTTILPLQQIHAIASSFTWRELEMRFRDVQAKPTMHQRVSAEFSRTEWDSGTVTEE